MNWFPFLRRSKEYFSPEQKNAIVAAVRDAEIMTSGEVRVFIESRCRYVDASDRAAELFFMLEMDETEDRNAVLVYVAVKDKQLAVFGDEGIHKKVGTGFWTEEVKKMLSAFNKEDYAEGIRQCVLDIGQALHLHFPYDHGTDKNELPDDIVFGR